MSVPEHLRYTADHEWLAPDERGARIGITAYAVEQLGDIVFLELPEPGTELVAGEAFGSVESVKAVSDLQAPVAGTVLEINAAVVADPASVNLDPYAAWLVRLQPSAPEQVGALLDANAYTALLEGA